MNPRSVMAAWKALLSAATRSAGTPDGARIGRAMACGATNSSRICRLRSSVANSATAGTSVAEKIRHLRGPQRAHRDMIDVARLGLAVVLDVDGGAVLHVLLRDVEHVPVGIVGGDARERPVGGPLQPLHARVARAHAIEDRLHVLDLDAETDRG